jgi:hypothetical protein
VSNTIRDHVQSDDRPGAGSLSAALGRGRRGRHPLE